MKRLIAVIALGLLVSGVLAEAANDYAGWWRTQSTDEKNSFIVRLIHDESNSGHFIFDAAEDKYGTRKMSAMIVTRLDSFYANPRNACLPVDSAAQIVLMKFAGARSETIAVLMQMLRRDHHCY